MKTEKNSKPSWLKCLHILNSEKINNPLQISIFFNLFIWGGFYFKNFVYDEVVLYCNINVSFCLQTRKGESWFH